MSNVIGLAGVVAVVVAVGELAGIWWAVLLAGVVAVAVAYAVHVNIERPAVSRVAAAAQPRRRDAA